MAVYQRILFAVDFSDEAMQVGERAVDLARRCHARLSLIHVVEPSKISAGYEWVPPLMGPGGFVTPLPPLPVDSAIEDVMQRARQVMEQLAERLGLEDADIQVVTSGSVKHTVHEMAREQQADLIIVGSQGRHGLALLLGSTANAVLHGAPCDVLAVRKKT